jgi:hypothetical protein
MVLQTVAQREQVGDGFAFAIKEHEVFQQTQNCGGDKTAQRA